MSADADDRFSLLDSLAEEFAERFRRGERPSIHEYAERHPELADDLREILGAMAQIEQAEVDVRGPGPLAATELLRPLDQVGDYRILREIGRGGMGIVYEAEQMSLKRHVALKVLLGRTGRNAAALERFRREARSAARLHHSNIVPVFEVGQHGDVLFYAMQMIAGQSLDQVLQEVRRLRSSVAASPHSTGQAAALLISGSFGRDGPPDATAPGTQPTAGIRSASSQRPSSGTNRSPYYRSIAQIGRQVAVALAYAHQHGVVHRDIKPSNLLLDLAGVVWITDFGLAKTDDEGLTQSGDVVGTLRYLAGQRRFQGQCDVRADIYALGLTLYEMLVIEPALEAPDRLRLIEMIRSQEPRLPRQIDAQAARPGEPSSSRRATRTRTAATRAPTTSRRPEAFSGRRDHQGAANVGGRAIGALAAPQPLVGRLAHDHILSADVRSGSDGQLSNLELGTAPMPRCGRRRMRTRHGNTKPGCACRGIAPVHLRMASMPSIYAFGRRAMSGALGPAGTVQARGRWTRALPRLGIGTTSIDFVIWSRSACRATMVRCFALPIRPTANGWHPPGAATCTSAIRERQSGRGKSSFTMPSAARRCTA